MKKYVYLFILIVSLALITGVVIIQKQPKQNSTAFSQEAADISSQPFEEIFHGKVLEVIEKDVEQNRHLSQISETLKVKALSGPEKGTELTVEYQDTLSNLKLQEVKTGDAVVVGKLTAGEDISYVMVDRYRLPYLGLIGIIFLVLAVIFGRIRGLTSVVGLLVSIGILLWFVTPNILAGKNPSLVTLIGAGIIAIVSIYLAHGFSKRTSLSVVSTLVTLGLAQGLAYIFVTGSHLAGNGSEDAFFLQAGYFGAINLQGLFFGGIIIGTLGILDDITTTQTATVEEIHTANTNLSFKELYRKAGSVGREHITSLINTLVLTYAGASLPLFLLFSVGSNKQLWTIINSGTIAEEIVRTLVGSIALIVAVPISTALAAYYYNRETKPIPTPKRTDDYWDQAINSVNKNTTT
jgi:uncharacterized membrane protein